jgi:hypothetical protein
MKRILPLLLVLPLALIAATVALGANWIVTCSQSHINNDDPIVFPNQPGVSHTHLYVGARNTDAFSTPSSLRAGGTTCGMAGDTSGYWEPKPLNYNLHPNGGALFYYSGSASVRPFPDGLRMIVGNSKATSEVTNPGIVSGNIKFKCGPGSNPYFARPPASCSSGMMVPTVTFPKFWDGVHLDSFDHLSHMSYSRNAAHPIELPKIVAYVRHAVGPGPINFTLSSGPYYTYHLDFLNAWDPAALQRFVDQCMKTGSNCGTNPQ